MIHKLHEMPTYGPGTVIYAINGNKSLGFIEMSDEDDRACLARLIVDSNREMNGFGSSLLAAVMEWGLAKNLFLTVATLEPERNLDQVKEWFINRGYNVVGNGMRGNVEEVRKLCLERMGLYGVKYQIITRG